jgi:hypothetical protein
VPKRIQINAIMFPNFLKSGTIPDCLLDINPNKSPGPDGIHPKALKETAAILAKPLTKIYNASLQSGIVPDLWKLGNVWVYI